MNSTSDTISSKSLSIRSETKDKFDALLKAALNKSKTIKVQSDSKENLLLSDRDSTTANSDVLEDQIEDFEKISKVGKPIPKPRLRRRDNDNFNASTSTFNVTDLPPKNSEERSDSSNRTFNISPRKIVEAIGDVLIHDSLSNQKVIVVTEDKARKFAENDIELTDTVEYTNEIKPKPRVRQNKTGIKSEEQVVKNDGDVPYDYANILQIVVHKCERLPLHSFVIHPVVKIHIVDGESGAYFQKSDKRRPVVFYYESKEYEYISPIMTHPFDLRTHRSLQLLWEEMVVINDDYNYILENASKIVIFFEILDFSTFSDLSSDRNKTGWHNIAFAFIKLGINNEPVNLDKKLRLQLYYPYKTPKKQQLQKCYVWNWWKTKKLKKFPSTLFVTIKKLISPSKIIEVFRSKTPNESEKHVELNIPSKNSEDTPLEMEMTEIQTKPIQWSRNTHEDCKLPNCLLGKLNSYDDGCLVMKFSHNGIYLACAVYAESIYSIVIYSVKTLEEYCKFPSHQALIYSINWSKDDQLIVSGSADNTVAIWNVTTITFLQILPHPSFVYASAIANDDTIATGGYDKCLRIWSKNKNYTLQQEFDEHQGFITCICFNRKSNLLYTSDSIGCIIQWEKSENAWKFQREILIYEMRTIIINSILLFPKENRLLISTRDNLLRIIDIKTCCVLNKLMNNSRFRCQIFPTMTPCGNLVLCGGDKNSVNAWNAKTGKSVAIYNAVFGNEENIAVHCVQFHPLDNILAISHYGEDLDILLFEYDQNCQNIDVRLSVFDMKSDIKKSNNNEDKKNITEINDENVYDFRTILNKIDEIIYPLTKNLDE